jgi:uncharacterized protein (TIGR03437 family)
MRHLRLAKSFVCVFLATAGFAAAQVTIGSIVNAGSRLPSTSPFFGIAQGSLFAIRGKDLGPDPLQQASFPLPTTDGLAGITVQASVGGATVDCIMVYVSPIEVGAILPSMIPIGKGTVTLNNNGVTASGPITVVAAAFGIFTQTPKSGAAQALAFNLNPDGSATLNTSMQSVQPGQDMLINGTGLGAITSDETQSGVTDVPTTAIQVYAGIMPATVVSAGRGLCCDGLDPSYPIPPGIAAWDVIQFTIPAGVTGCAIPLVVQVGKVVSNLATISIDPSGAACTLIPSTLPTALTQKLSGKPDVTFGSVALVRNTGMSVTAAGAIRTTKSDTGSASFVGENVPASMIAAEVIYPVNSCSINGYPGPNGTVVVNGNPVTIVPLKEVNLDAGPTITLKGPSGTRAITGQTVGMLGVYYRGVTLGNSTPGNYLDPGHYTITGPGGKDVGAFTASTDVPSTPFVWTNIPSVAAPLDRSKDLTIKWTGGIPDTQVVVVGATGTQAFLCAAPVSAGQMTIPSYVLLSVPASAPPLNAGGLGLSNTSVSLFTVTGLDIASIRYSEDYSLSLMFQ